MAFCWQANDDLLLVVFGPPPKLEKKTLESWTPSENFFWIRAYSLSTWKFCMLFVIQLKIDLKGIAPDQTDPYGRPNGRLSV